MNGHRGIAMVLILCVLLGFTGCGRSVVPNADPEPFEIPGSRPFDVELETDYTNITAETDFTAYPKNVEKIGCTITNNNVARGFYFYSIPYIEKYENGEWVRLSYYPSDYDNEAGRWNLCAIDGNKTDKYSTYLILSTEYVSPRITKGDYRLVIFVGDQILYAQFEITD